MPVTTQLAAHQPEQSLDFRAALLGETPEGVTIDEAEKRTEENEDVSTTTIQQQLTQTQESQPQEQQFRSLEDLVEQTQQPEEHLDFKAALLGDTPEGITIEEAQERQQKEEVEQPQPQAQPEEGPLILNRVPEQQAQAAPVETEQPEEHLDFKAALLGETPEGITIEEAQERQQQEETQDLQQPEQSPLLENRVQPVAQQAFEPDLDFKAALLGETPEGITIEEAQERNLQEEETELNASGTAQEQPTVQAQPTFEPDLDFKAALLGETPEGITIETALEREHDEQERAEFCAAHPFHPSLDFRSALLGETPEGFTIEEVQLRELQEQEAAERNLITQQESTLSQNLAQALATPPTLQEEPAQEFVQEPVQKPEQEPLTQELPPFEPGLDFKAALLGETPDGYTIEEAQERDQQEQEEAEYLAAHPPVPRAPLPAFEPDLDFKAALLGETPEGITIETALEREHDEQERAEFCAAHPFHPSLDFRSALLGETPEGISIEEAREHQAEHEQNIGEDHIDRTVLVVGTDKNLEAEQEFKLDSEVKGTMQPELQSFEDTVESTEMSALEPREIQTTTDEAKETLEQGAKWTKQHPVQLRKGWQQIPQKNELPKKGSELKKESKRKAAAVKETTEQATEEQESETIVAEQETTQEASEDIVQQKGTELKSRGAAKEIPQKDAEVKRDIKEKVEEFKEAIGEAKEAVQAVKEKSAEVKELLQTTQSAKRVIPQRGVTKKHLQKGVASAAGSAQRPLSGKGPAAKKDVKATQQAAKQETTPKAGQAQKLKEIVMEKGAELKESVQQKGVLQTGIELKNVALEKGTHLKDAALEKGAHMKDVALGVGVDIKEQVQQKGVIQTGVDMGTSLKNAALEKGAELTDAALERTGLTNLAQLKEKGAEIKESVQQKGVIQTATELSTDLKGLAVERTQHLKEAAMEKTVEFKDAAMERSGLIGLKDFALEKSAEIQDSVREKGVIKTATTVGFDLKDAALEKGTQFKDAALGKVFGTAEKTEETTEKSETENTEVRQEVMKLKDAVLEAKDAALEFGAGLKDSVKEKGVISTVGDVKDLAFEAGSHIKDAMLEKGVELKDAAWSRVPFIGHKKEQTAGSESNELLQERMEELNEAIGEAKEAVQTVKDKGAELKELIQGAATEGKQEQTMTTEKPAETTETTEAHKLKDAVLEVKDAAWEYGAELKDSLKEKGVFKTGVEVTTELKGFAYETGSHLKEAMLSKVFGPQKDGSSEKTEEAGHLKEAVKELGSELKELGVLGTVGEVKDIAVEAASDLKGALMDKAHSVLERPIHAVDAVQDAAFGIAHSMVDRTFGALHNLKAAVLRTKEEAKAESTIQQKEESEDKASSTINTAFDEQKLIPPVGPFEAEREHTPLESMRTK